MRPGVDRTDVEYAWPPQLSRPSHDIKLVYLDLNHWISLAKANVGHRDGERHRPALEALRAAKDQIIVPLSSTHYMEMSGIKDPRHRLDIATIMEELSGFRTIMTSSIIVPLELDAALARLADITPRFAPMSLIGQGVLQAFGKVGGLRIRSSEDGADITQHARFAFGDGPEAFDTWRREAELLLDRSVLRGPQTEEDVAALKTRSWDPTVARRGAEARAQQEREQAARLDSESRWRRGRLRDLVGARYLTLEIKDWLGEALDAHGLNGGSLFSGPDDFRAFVDSMPSGDAWVTLVAAAHRNGGTPWKSNDMFDIDALNFAVPYCDIVVTEKHRSHVLVTAKLPERTGTTVIATLDALIPLLS
jgi:hypothetical protein